MRITTESGKFYQGTALEVVDGMRRDDFSGIATAREYMLVLATRADEVYGVEVSIPRDATDEVAAMVLLGALLDAGIVKES